jgi:hypothetical protein
MKRRQKFKARSIEESWSVSMWEPPKPVQIYILRQRDKDEKGNQTIKFESVEIYERPKRQRKRRTD